MIIDTNLRLAIKAAEKAQPDIDRYKESEKRTQWAINELLTRKPALRRKALSLRARAIKMQKLADAARKQLCDSFGLRMGASPKLFDFACCSSQNENFVKAGGVPPDPVPFKWKFNDVMARLASATDAQGAAIIKSLGIIWE